MISLLVLDLANDISDPLAHLQPSQAAKHRSGQYAKSGAESVIWNTHDPELEWLSLLILFYCV